MKKWEYKELYYNGHNEQEHIKNYDMEEYGKEGWELVAVIRHPVHGYFIYYFKREIQEDVGFELLK